MSEDHRDVPTAQLRLALVGVLSWLLFALAWWRVRELHAEVGEDVLAALVACALLVLAVDLWWVAHNRRIFRRKGPRRGLPAPAVDRGRDSLGRPVRWVDGAGDAQLVVLSMAADGVKTCRPWSDR